MRSVSDTYDGAGVVLATGSYVAFTARADDRRQRVLTSEHALRLETLPARRSCWAAA